MEIEGLTGDIRFAESGRRENYTLHVVEMTVNSAMVQVRQRKIFNQLRAHETIPSYFLCNIFSVDC